MQAMEAVKLLLDIGEPAVGKLVHFNALTTTTRHFKLQADPQCPLCGKNPTFKTLKDSHPQQSTNTKPMKEIDVFELKKRLDSNQVEFLLDVRMPHEYEVSNLGGHLLPLPELAEKLDTLPKNKAILIHCKAGVRSAKACYILQEAGFSDVTNIAGGTDAWRHFIDPLLPS